MQVYVFKTNDIESKLDKVRSNLIILNYSLYGLLKEESIERKEFSAFYNIIDDAGIIVDSLMKSMRPISITDESLKNILQRKNLNE